MIPRTEQKWASITNTIRESPSSDTPDPRNRLALSSPHSTKSLDLCVSLFQSAKNLSPFAGCPRSRRGEGERSAANTLVVAKSCDRRPCAQCELFIRFFSLCDSVCVLLLPARTITYKRAFGAGRVREWVLFYYNGMWNWHASNNK